MRLSVISQGLSHCPLWIELWVGPRVVGLTQRLTRFRTGGVERLANPKLGGSPQQGKSCPRIPTEMAPTPCWFSGLVLPKHQPQKFEILWMCPYSFRSSAFLLNCFLLCGAFNFGCKTTVFERSGHTCDFVGVQKSFIEHEKQSTCLEKRCQQTIQTIQSASYSPVGVLWVYTLCPRACLMALGDSHALFKSSLQIISTTCLMYTIKTSHEEKYSSCLLHQL